MTLNPLKLRQVARVGVLSNGMLGILTDVSGLKSGTVLYQLDEKKQEQSQEVLECEEEVKTGNRELGLAKLAYSNASWRLASAIAKLNYVLISELLPPSLRELLKPFEKIPFTHHLGSNRVTNRLSEAPLEHMFVYKDKTFIAAIRAEIQQTEPPSH